LFNTLYFFKNTLTTLCCRPRPTAEVYASNDAIAYLPECLLIISNLFWNICFSVTCWISVSSLTMEYSVLSNRHSASSHRSSLGMRCWYFLERERPLSVANSEPPGYRDRYPFTLVTLWPFSVTARWGNRVWTGSRFGCPTPPWRTPTGFRLNRPEANNSKKFYPNIEVIRRTSSQDTDILFYTNCVEIRGHRPW